VREFLVVTIFNLHSTFPLHTDRNLHVVSTQ